MSRSRRILWTEGMFLTPHHFQQWDNYYENTLDFRLKALTAFAWGLTELEIRREGISNGQVTLTRCSGLLPGGTAFSIPESDEAPPTRSVEGHFTAAAKSLDVYLGVGLKRSSASNVAFDAKEGARPARFRSDLIKVIDEASGENERELPVVQHNLRILFADEALTDYETIKIAELKRTGQGVIALDENYIPPCLCIAASRYLQDMTLRLLEILHAKGSSLGEGRGQRTRGLAEFSTGDVANFWLLHTVNSFIPILDHYHRTSRSHPEQLFLMLAQLAGELMTFSPSGQPRDLPKYNHVNLGLTFVPLDETIQELLKTVIPTGAVQIPLKRESESKFTGQIVDDQLVIGAQVFLAASAEISEGQLITELPQQAKISSMDRIESLLGLALPGVALAHRPVPPSPLRVKLDYQYFRLENQGTPEIQQHWDAICRSRNIAIRIPNPKRFAGLKLELWSIKE
ncbi:MAG: type VI secretion system baseplate subunit TssK [Acidobacteria bacterium]|nr:type VI secretion system baseplate subunit TssK [Acidobacteriota bacterium]